MKKAGFNPRALFAASEPGAWYDPSDLSTMYQDRIEIFDGEMWEALGEGKAYIKSWKDKQTIDQEIINHAIEWLCPMCEVFTEVEFYNLVSEFNHNQHKKQADL